MTYTLFTYELWFLVRENRDQFSGVQITIEHVNFGNVSVKMYLCS